MVVGVLSTSYPRHAGDFAGCFVEDDVRLRARAGATIDVIAAGAGPPGVTTARAGGLTVTRIGTGVWPAGASLFYGDGAPETLEAGGVAAWLQALHFWGALCQQIERAAPRWDRMVSHWLLPCGLAAATIAPGLAHRAYAHSGDVALLERLPCGRALARRMARSGAELIFVTRNLQLRFGALAGQLVGQVEPLRPDAALFAPASPEDRLDARRRLGVAGPLVVAVGRLVPVKGFDRLVDACAPLAGDQATAALVILGDGPERRALRVRAERRRVALRLPGTVPRSELPLWLAAADVYVQPSRTLPSGRTEGLPMATLEALAVGVPIIAARSGGLIELGQRASGVTLVDADDPRSLRRALWRQLDGRNRPAPDA
jgi:glycosyltransferase involved in cell wall biosynthesis